MCVYLSFNDTTVQGVVLLFVKKTELQRPQSSCRNKNTTTHQTLKERDNLNFSPVGETSFLLKQINIDLSLFIAPLGTSVRAHEEEFILFKVKMSRKVNIWDTGGWLQRNNRSYWHRLSRSHCPPLFDLVLVLGELDC